MERLEKKPTREVEHLGSLRYLPLLGEQDQLNGFGAVKLAFGEVMELDQTIFRYAQALEVVQPSAPGKISIRFLRRRSGETDSRHPTFVQWFKGSSGRWLYERLGEGEVLRKLRGYSAFQLTRDDARELITQARHLIQLRESLLENVGKMKRTLAMQSKKIRQAQEPLRLALERRFPELTARRAAIIEEVRAAKSFAVGELPEELYADDSTLPRTHPQGRTRGTRTLSKPRGK